MWNALDIIMGCLLPFIMGGAMRYASRKWNRPLLVTVCLIFIVIVIEIAIAIQKGTFLRTFNIRVVLYACMILGALIADLIYRIRRKQTRN